MSSLNDGLQDPTQLLLAKLVTNPRYVREVISNADEFLNILGIEKNQKIELVDFFKNHGEKFLASSQLLAKKRLDNIVEAMQVGRKIFSYELLKRYFENYLEKTGLDEYVDKNPISESILFCKYIIANENTDEREKVILDYDLTRNIVLQQLMNDHKSYESLVYDLETVINTKDCQLSALIHPSIQIKKFPAGTSLMVKAIINNVPNVGISASTDEEILIFHKNWRKGGVVTLKVSPPTVEFIKILMRCDTLEHSYQMLNKELGADIEISKSMVKQFIECGLCTIRFVGRKYV
ncbi:MAG: hypothetical protein A3F11_03590 [Gammaproteobacteria bacterium RIFCSPHIGHO2_12_FULL_37_14]|nr:MAG: hypothetical protein A3F11_03590 [Gammaproteobacteria bacterium RIFCSPHIGHO2_12_FULL_37_14]